MSARFAVEKDRLLAGDEILLTGPVDHLTHFCAVLDAADPADDRIAPVLRRLIAATRGCSFAPGERLLQDDTPMNHLTRHRKET